MRKEGVEGRVLLFMFDTFFLNTMRSATIDPDECGCKSFWYHRLYESAPLLCCAALAQVISKVPYTYPQRFWKDTRLLVRLILLSDEDKVQ